MEEDLPYFHQLIRQSVEQDGLGMDAIYSACRELIEHNPGLGETVRVGAMALNETVTNRFGNVDWVVCFAYIAGELAMLRLIDRALEAKSADNKVE